MTKTITQAELRNGSARVMDALQAGQEFVITRNGTPVGELRPIRARRKLSAEDVARVFAGLPTGSTYQQMRREADDIFGEDRVGDD